MNPMGTQSLVNMYTNHPGWLFLLITWSLFWKGLALWKAGRNNHMGWFIAIFLINTLGLLEIFYLAYWSERKPRA